jgi:hypothetical protein
MRAPRRRSLAVVLAAVVANAAALVGGSTAYGSASRPASKPSVRQVGYYIQWGVYGRGFFVKNLDTPEVITNPHLRAPAPLEPSDAGEVLICCSHPDDDVILDS